MITEEAVRSYRTDGFVVVPGMLDAALLAEVRSVIAEIVAGAANVDAHNEVYDLEPGHTRAEPKVRRIKAPHKVHPLFDRLGTPAAGRLDHAGSDRAGAAAVRR